MALKSTREKREESSNNSFKKATEIEVGEMVSGYLVALPANRFDESNKDVVIRSKETGTELRIATAGQLKRDVKDGHLTVGQFTQITRLKDRQEKSKEGKSYTLTDFETLQDADDTTTDLAFIAATSETPKVAKTANFDISQVRAQAAQIKEQSKSK